MFNKRFLLIILSGALLLAVALITGFIAQNAAVAQEEGAYIYAAKFVCGVQTPSQITTPVRPGHYATEINIYNHNLEPVDLDKKVILVVSEDGPLGREPEQRGPTGFETITLDPEHATMDDCYQIARMVNQNPNVPSLPRLIGYLVIESKDDLDVNAVYTTGSLSGPLYRVPSIDVERVPGVFEQR